jgi:hypothetical protein
VKQANPWYSVKQFVEVPLILLGANLYAITETERKRGGQNLENSPQNTFIDTVQINVEHASKKIC